VQAGLQVSPPQDGAQLLFDEIGLTFLEQQHRALAGTEGAELLGHERIDDIQVEDRNRRLAAGIGKPELLQRPDKAVVETALDDQSDIVAFAFEELVELLLDDETP